MLSELFVALGRDVKNTAQTAWAEKQVSVALPAPKPKLTMSMGRPVAAVILKQVAYPICCGFSN